MIRAPSREGRPLTSQKSPPAFDPFTAHPIHFNPLDHSEPSLTDLKRMTSN